MFITAFGLLPPAEVPTLKRLSMMSPGLITAWKFLASSRAICARLASSAISTGNRVSIPADVGGTNSNAPIPLRPMYASLSRTDRSFVRMLLALAHSENTTLPQWSGNESAMKDGRPPKSLLSSGYTGSPFRAATLDSGHRSGAMSGPFSTYPGSK